MEKSPDPIKPTWLWMILALFIALTCTAERSYDPDTLITVTTVNDTFNVNGRTCGNVLISELPGTDGQISLREAICASNNTAAGAPHTIAFSIGTGVKTIAPTSMLPGISRPVTIDGTTQPGFAGKPIIVLDGVGAGSADGLDLFAGNTTVKGLVIQRFSFYGIYISNLGGNLVQGCYVGVASDGTTARGNGHAGIRISLVATGNTIGGTSAGQGNLISANSDHGVLIDRGFDTQILGNKIGTNVSGTAALPNLGDGVHVWRSRNLIVGNAQGGGNLISGNQDNGIEIWRSASRNWVISGNLIGVNAAGSAALPNGRNGIVLYDSPYGRIGGAGVGDGNLISGNLYHGIAISGNGLPYFEPSSPTLLVLGNKIGTNLTGTAAIPNGRHGVNLGYTRLVQVGGAGYGESNLISGNLRNGIFLNGRSSKVWGNKIGTNALGSAALPNQQNGVVVVRDQNNIGGTGGNLISGNLATGVVLRGSQATKNLVASNLIGVDATGLAALPNGQNGLALLDAGFNTIGGQAASDGNLISANDGYGVLIKGVGAAFNQLLNNIIGSDLKTSLSLANTYGGVLILSAPENQLGLSGGGSGNLISGNGGPGVTIQSSDAKHNQLYANKIGVDGAGMAALANLGDGVVIIDAPQSDLEDNLIAANNGHGVAITGQGASQSTLLGNWIGVKANGMPLGNTLNGILISDADSTTVGAWQRGNTIASNHRSGIAVVGSAQGASLLFNSIFDNYRLGIDLADNWATLNDSLDGDSGPNGLQNFPKINNVSHGVGTVTLQGTLNSQPLRLIQMQFFASQVCDPTGYGEGKIFLGSATMTTSPTGDASFNVMFASSPGSTFYTATATDQTSGDTSEFSPCNPLPKLLYLPLAQRK